MAKRPTEPKTERIKILIVDDEEPIRNLLARYLSDRYTCLTAASADEAVALLSRDYFHLVMTDITMPGASGIELCQFVQRTCPETVVLVVSGMTDITYAIDAMRHGAFDYITKPFDLPQMQLSVERALRLDSLHVETDRLNNLIRYLAKENQRLKELEGKDIEFFRAICGVLAHDLRSEFLNIADTIKEIREETEASPEIQEEYDLIQRSIEYSQLLVRRLLNYIQIGKPRVEPINLSTLLRKVKTLARPRLPSNIKLKVQATRKKQVVQVDVEQLTGVLLELIKNAASELREKGGTIELGAEETSTASRFNSNRGEFEIPKEQFVIYVKDSGPGIPNDLQDLLFKEPVTSKQGSGLGLFLSKKALQTMRCDLRLQSSSAEGTTFIVLLPQDSNEQVA